MKQECYLSIDFEDFSYDYRKMHKISFNERINKKKIDESFNVINKFCNDYLSSKKITFFCTGILAKKYPDIIKRISDHGHEVACHYFYHDYVNKDNLIDFENNLLKAKYYLNKYSNQEIKGFRAPFFSLKKNNIDYLNVLSKHFEYDSSLSFTSIKELENYISINSIKNIKLYPVFHRNYFNLFNIKIGGTYMKLLSKHSLSSLINLSVSKKIIPILYLHPYEFMPDKTFFLNFNKINGISFRKKIFIYFNQFRWHFFNKPIINKLSFIYSEFDSPGKMLDINYRKFFNS
jgi:hypothetical protein